MRLVFYSIISVVLVFSVTSCINQDKSKVLAQYKYEEDNNNIYTTKLEKKLEPWVKKGVECYGLIMICNKEGDPLRMKEVHIRVIDVQAQSLKMEALEDVVANRTTECQKVSFKKGDSWNEEYGEIFKTRQEAIEYIDTKYPGLRVKH